MPSVSASHTVQTVRSEWVLVGGPVCGRHAGCQLAHRKHGPRRTQHLVVEGACVVVWRQRVRRPCKPTRRPRGAAGTAAAAAGLGGVGHTDCFCNSPCTLR
eukprot:gnl/Hemi2/6729_TR2294_c0_g1_i1.p3 gnl/Hemi2/6729_TR2294_c0_g1~~gnl/Hemi2/6729_TR2294_c0_g1_i1.p3  ORF type:complete len:101 (+),score=9.66 gnl/Hemi2/6729_TR2294_c0_g1_i1:178-480(+)